MLLLLLLACATMWQLRGEKKGWHMSKNSTWRRAVSLEETAAQHPGAQRSVQQVTSKLGSLCAGREVGLDSSPACINASSPALQPLLRDAIQVRLTWLRPPQLRPACCLSLGCLAPLLALLLTVLCPLFCC